MVLERWRLGDADLSTEPGWIPEWDEDLRRAEGEGGLPVGWGSALRKGEGDLILMLGPKSSFDAPGAGKGDV